MPQAHRRTDVFISYSREDQVWLDHVLVHLKPLQRDQHINIWSDQKIQSGARWREELHAALQRARIAVLLVSAEFLASDFITNDELPPLLKAAEDEGVLILPVILAPCRFEDTESLAQFQAVNSPSQPLRNLRKGQWERVLLKLSRDIEHALKADVAPTSAKPPNSSSSRYDDASHLPNSKPATSGRPPESMRKSHSAPDDEEVSPRPAAKDDCRDRGRSRNGVLVAALIPAVFVSVAVYEYADSLLLAAILPVIVVAILLVSLGMTSWTRTNS